jgi:hypothetical protein
MSGGSYLGKDYPPQHSQRITRAMRTMDKKVEGKGNAGDTLGQHLEQSQKALEIPCLWLKGGRVLRLMRESPK